MFQVKKLSTSPSTSTEIASRDVAGFLWLRVHAGFRESVGDESPPAGSRGRPPVEVWR